MWQVQYFKDDWVNWAQSPTLELAEKYASLIRLRYRTRIFRVDA